MPEHSPVLFAQETFSYGSKVHFYFGYPGLYASPAQVLAWLETWPQANANDPAGNDFQRNLNYFWAIRLDGYKLLVVTRQQLTRLFHAVGLQPFTADWLTTDIWVARQIFKDRNFGRHKHFFVSPTPDFKKLDQLQKERRMQEVLGHLKRNYKQNEVFWTTSLKVKIFFVGGFLWLFGFALVDQFITFFAGLGPLQPLSLAVLYTAAVYCLIRVAPTVLDIELPNIPKERKPAKMPKVVNAVIIGKKSKKDKKHQKGLRRRLNRIKTEKLESRSTSKEMGSITKEMEKLQSKLAEDSEKKYLAEKKKARELEDAKKEAAKSGLITKAEWLADLKEKHKGEKFAYFERMMNPALPETYDELEEKHILTLHGAYPAMSSKMPKGGPKKYGLYDLEAEERATEASIEAGEAELRARRKELGLSNSEPDEEGYY